MTKISTKGEKLDVYGSSSSLISGSECRSLTEGRRLCFKKMSKARIPPKITVVKERMIIATEKHNYSIWKVNSHQCKVSGIRYCPYSRIPAPNYSECT